MLSRSFGIGSIAVMATVLVSGGFSKPAIKPIEMPPLRQPAEWHAIRPCYKWGVTVPSTPAPHLGRRSSKWCASPHLNYYGGPILHSVKVVKVIYGAGTYQSFITGTGSGTMAAFYAGVTNSVYMDWLTEYNTTSPSQTITRGTYAGSYTITPSSSHDKTTITDAQIQAELVAQITAGHLPGPDANTVYMIHFPKGKTISQGGTYSCRSGGFCAYHGTLNYNGGFVYYGVLPDMSAGTGCASGCGGGTPFGNQCSVASHEMIETVTDAGVGQATTYSYPLAWYDPNNGEIGDICNGQQATVVGGDGATYTVQKLWSNARGACVSQ